MTAIFGGRKSSASSSAVAEAKKSREVQLIANNRQLAQQKAEQTRSTVKRRRPRGRRLFSTDERSKSSLA